MTDPAFDDTRFEADLRAVLADLAPDAAPGSLHAAVAGVPGRLERRAPGGRRALVAVLGLAAAVVVAVAGIGLIIGQRPVGPAGVTPNGGLPTGVPSPAPALETLTFRVVTPDGSMATKAQVLAVESVMEARLQAYGIGNFSSSGGDDRITFEVPLPDASPSSVASMRDLLGTTGAFSIMPPSADALSDGDRVAGPPLFTGDAVTDARTGTDQSGNTTLDLTLDAQAGAALAATTRAHIGEYLAIALDGLVVAVPMVNSEIPDARVQISFAGDEDTPARLAAILQTGPLPLPVEAVTP